jgi:pyruvate,water dikinase
MSIGPLRFLSGLLHGRRARREKAALDWLKARYHIFRMILADNERALSGLAEVDRLLRDNEHARLAASLGLLRESVLEMVDGLNRLTSNAHAALYSRLAVLDAELDTALERYGGAPRRLWLPLSELRADMRGEAGGKALPLGGLKRAGLPVPEGVCILRRTCREFLRRARLEGRLKAVLAEASRPGADLDALAARARAMIAAAEPGPELRDGLAAAWESLAGPEGTDGNAARAISVRSSAGAEDGSERSFAGQFASVLGVRDLPGFLAAFRTVLASAFSPRALAYRLQAGLGGEDLDMAVLCQRLVDARASGVLFTVDPLKPEGDRMLLTAVPGLGTLAVSGRAPADVYRPARQPAADRGGVPRDIAAKTVMELPAPEGGLVRVEVPEAERLLPLLDDGQVAALRDHGLRIEALAGCPQDIEWSLDTAGRLWILQARPARLARSNRTAEQMDVAPPATVTAPLVTGGVPASPGKAAGRVVVARTRAELDEAAKAPRPVVLVLRQSLVDAASLAPECAALLVDMGNPLDHLGTLARELGIPMLTGLDTATTVLRPGDWVLVDADQGEVRPADPRLWRGAPPPALRHSAADEAAEALRGLVLPLNLTDAYGPTFSALECRSLHDLVRFCHEKAVVALFEAGDSITDEAFSLVRRLRDPSGLLFLIIDLGGGLAPTRSAQIDPGHILCEPLAALRRGMATPGLRWGVAPPVMAGGLSGVMSRGMLDARSERPLGNPNYALVSRDYLNLNARVDFHFVLVDAVCGANPRENSIRFRFKGGGTALPQRERRARFVEEVLRGEDFFTSRQGDLVTGILAEGGRETILAKLEMLGRFIGFSRLLDAVMLDDGMPGRVARAFREGDYGLAGLEIDMK